MQRIENLRWKPHWVSHLGCVQGCLDHLGISLSDGWLYGGTGHAFVINMHNELCPSGPTAWNTGMLFELGRNLGYEFDTLAMAIGPQADYAAARQQAWTKVREAIDAGTPCYGWGFGFPEFLVVNGYDEVGYYLSGPGSEEREMPFPWEKLGTDDVGIIEVYAIKPGTAAPDIQVIKRAFEQALKHAANPPDWIFPGYKSGVAGFDAWIAALEADSLTDDDGDPLLGLAFNAGVWEECRRNAVAFLDEAKTRMANGHTALFDEALTSYHTVAENLKGVAELYPFFGRKPEMLQDVERKQTALTHLRAAREAEATGLNTLARICEAI